jgi:neuronal PAS domain-containing protein 1/3
MTGSSVFDYIHSADQAELAEQLGITLSEHGSRGGDVSPATSPAASDNQNHHHHHSSQHLLPASPCDDSSSGTRLAPSPNPHNPDGK